MILAIDVQYQQNTAFIAGVVFEHWDSNTATAEYTSHLEDIAEYEPGKFFKRELPCILTLLNEHQLQPEIIVVDGYVYLDGISKPGLGKYLWDAIGNDLLIIGVAKKAFSDISDEFQIFRGTSEKPLYVTSTENISQAKKNIISMSGKHRIPTLLKRADQLCRQEASKVIPK